MIIVTRNRPAQKWHVLLTNEGDFGMVSNAFRTYIVFKSAISIANGLSFVGGYIHTQLLLSTAEDSDPIENHKKQRVEPERV